jgi:hypothetical protein
LMVTWGFPKDGSFGKRISLLNTQFWSKEIDVGTLYEKLHILFLIYHIFNLIV